MDKTKPHLSVIIPTLNEADYLKDTIDGIRENSSGDILTEIIVVDGGSVDRTREVAEECHVRCITYSNAPQGRAFLMNKGAEHAHGNIYLFLDADSILPKGYDTEIILRLSKKNIIGGAFEFKLSGSEFGLRIVELFNRLRYRIWPRYYGDQGIFVTKEVFSRVGGYPKISLMEASEFCLLVSKFGDLSLIHRPVVTSSRRFVEGGIYRVFGQGFKLWWLNLLGKDVQPYASEYWNSK